MEITKTKITRKVCLRPRVCVFANFVVQVHAKNVAGEVADIDLVDFWIAVLNTSHVREDRVRNIRHPASFPFVKNNAETPSKSFLVSQLNYYLIYGSSLCRKRNVFLFIFFLFLNNMTVFKLFIKISRYLYLF